jgi:phage I-like protein
LPVQKDWATELGNKDVAALKSYLEKTPAIAALKGSQTRGKSPEGADDEVLTADELAVCKNLGISAEDYKKANPAPA